MTALLITGVKDKTPLTDILCKAKTPGDLTGPRRSIERRENCVLMAKRMKEPGYFNHFNKALTKIIVYFL